MAVNDIKNKDYDEILSELQQAALNSWRGETGIARKDEITKFVTSLTRQYSEVLGITELEVLQAIESKRTYSAINYYQEANFPKLNDDIQIFDTNEDFFKKYPSKKFICPNCKGISTDPNECNSGLKVKLINSNGKKETCNWKSYGLFGTLGKGIRFIIKSDFLNHPNVYSIFKPIEEN